MSVDQSLMSLFTQASPLVKLVMLLLVAASVVSWMLIFQGRQAFRRAERTSQSFEDGFWSGVDLHRLYQKYSATPTQHGHGSQQLFLAGFREYLKLRTQTQMPSDLRMASLERAMRVALSKELDALEKPLPFLATVGSVSPYVGLFGTVWGIMNALRALGAVQQANLAMVAPGISEALVATAMGLFAAIPAVIAYNRYSTRLQRLTNQYTIFMDEFLGLLNRQLHTKTSSRESHHSHPNPPIEMSDFSELLDSGF